MAGQADRPRISGRGGVVINDDRLIAEAAWAIRVGCKRMAEPPRVVRPSAPDAGQAGDPLEPFRQLRPPTLWDFSAAKRAGRDPNKLLVDFTDQYDAGCGEASCRIDARAGGDEHHRRELWASATNTPSSGRRLGGSGLDRRWHAV